MDAFRLAWYVLSGMALTVLLVSLLLPEELMLNLSQACRLPHAGCGLCGMTRAFVEISHGDFGAARSLNPLSPLLWGAMAVNGLFAVNSILRQNKEDSRANA